MDMNKLALAMAAAATLAFTAPSFAQGGAPERIQLARADVKVKIKSGPHMRTKFVVHDRGRHHGWDRGRHLGWRHAPHHGVKKTVIIKRAPSTRVVIKKKIQG
jgi:hypothetical protein